MGHVLFLPKIPEQTSPPVHLPEGVTPCRASSQAERKGPLPSALCPPELWENPPRTVDPRSCRADVTPTRRGGRTERRRRWAPGSCLSSCPELSPLGTCSGRTSPPAPAGPCRTLNVVWRRNAGDRNLDSITPSLHFSHVTALSPAPPCSPEMPDTPSDAWDSHTPASKKIPEATGRDHPKRARVPERSR